MLQQLLALIILHGVALYELHTLQLLIVHRLSILRLSGDHSRLHALVRALLDQAGLRVDVGLRLLLRWGDRGQL